MNPPFGSSAPPTFTHKNHGSTSRERQIQDLVNALMIWLLPFAESARIWAVVFLAYLIGIGELPHLIAAKEKQMLTIAWPGKDGGRLAEMADYSFVVPSYGIHRIQEVHATLVHIAWDLIHIALGEDDVV